MARQLRKKSGTGIYHVMVRGINRQDIFEDEEDYLQMVSILRALSDRHDEQGLRLPPLSIFYAYCLMSNHLHLLLREQEEEVSDVVKRIGVTYAHYFNKKYERSGHLFQDRFILTCGNLCRSDRHSCRLRSSRHPPWCTACTAYNG